MLAPNHVSAPATTQTSSMPPKVGTARLTSDGCTKIDEPTMVPTTIAVAWVRPIERASLSDTGRMLSPPSAPVAKPPQSPAPVPGTELRHRTPALVPGTELRHRTPAPEPGTDSGTELRHWCQALNSGTVL